MRKKVEYVPTTKEVITYEANDGTVFYSEEECSKYERSAFYAINFAFMSIPKSQCEGQDFLNDAAYMTCEGVMHGITIRNADDLQIINTYINAYYDQCYGGGDITSIPVDYIGKRVILEFYEGNTYLYGTLEEYKKTLCDAADHFFGENKEEK